MHVRKLLALIAVPLLLGCAVQKKPAPVALKVPVPPAPKLDPADILASKMQALNEKAQDPDLTDEQAQKLTQDMSALMAAYLQEGPEVRGSVKVQDALDQMCDLSLQLDLDANSAPDTYSIESPSPKDNLLHVTTFLSSSGLKKTYEAVEDAQKSVKVGIPIPMDNKAVLTYVNLYQTKLKDWFERTLVRGEPYIPQIKKIFKDEGVPPDLVYLAIVESGFRTHAVSRARAVGPWQFIAGTARHYGLKVNFWEDQRLDPLMGARAAARYLSTLYGMFHNWELALAAYNAGEARVLRGLRRHPGATFWDLKSYRLLRRETREYVPAILAAILIATNPKAYGFDIPADPPPPSAAVTIKNPTDVRVLAKCANESVEQLRAMNPSLRRYITPPYAYALRIPADRLDTFEAKYTKIPPEDRVKVDIHIVRSGESLWSIGRHYGVPYSAICIANRLRSNMLHRGQRLVIPIGMAARDPSLYSVGRRSSGRRHTFYRVRRGDSLYLISLRAGVSVSAIKSLNNLHSNLIHPGQRLKLIGSTRMASRRRGRLKHPSPRPGTRMHHVRRGDTLYDLARRYGTSVRELCRLNGISARTTLHPGDNLLIPR